MRYKLFGQHTGLRVSELVLGTGNFGTGWGYGSEPDESRRILDAYLDAGGNFLDSADVYQNGQSEQILGDALVGRREAAEHGVTRENDEVVTIDDSVPGVTITAESGDLHVTTLARGILSTGEVDTL